LSKVRFLFIDDSLDLVELGEMGRVDVFFSKNPFKGKYFTGWLGMVVKVPDGVDRGMGS
jgi:hypothetical protein